MSFDIRDVNGNSNNRSKINIKVVGKVILSNTRPRTWLSIKEKIKGAEILDRDTFVPPGLCSVLGIQMARTLLDF